MDGTQSPCGFLNNHIWLEELALASRIMVGWNKWSLTGSLYAMLIRTWATLKSHSIV